MSEAIIESIENRVMALKSEMYKAIEQKQLYEENINTLDQNIIIFRTCLAELEMLIKPEGSEK